MLHSLPGHLPGLAHPYYFIFIFLKKEKQKRKRKRRARCFSFFLASITLSLSVLQNRTTALTLSLPTAPRSLHRRRR
jgi:hypothetical protein